MDLAGFVHVVQAERIFVYAHMHVGTYANDDYSLRLKGLFKGEIEKKEIYVMFPMYVRKCVCVFV